MLLVFLTIKINNQNHTCQRLGFKIQEFFPGLVSRLPMQRAAAPLGSGCGNRWVDLYVVCGLCVQIVFH